LAGARLLLQQYQAVKWNKENIILTNQPELVKAFAQEFDKLADKFKDNVLQQ
jgi:hypothetical protein